ncbi:hypothetical protein ACROYT_G022147 [Oculina patagonica]
MLKTTRRRTRRRRRRQFLCQATDSKVSASLTRMSWDYSIVQVQLRSKRRKLLFTSFAKTNAACRQRSGRNDRLPKNCISP